MSNSSHSAQVHNIACSNRNSCHPILFCLGLTYVVLMVLYLVGSTCFDRMGRVGSRDVESNVGRRGDGWNSGFEKVRVFGAGPGI